MIAPLITATPAQLHALRLIVEGGISFGLITTFYGPCGVPTTGTMLVQRLAEEGLVIVHPDMVPPRVEFTSLGELAARLALN